MHIPYCPVCKQPDRQYATRLWFVTESNILTTRTKINHPFQRMEIFAYDSTKIQKALA